MLQLSEFSNALTAVLASLDKKVTSLDSGGSKVLSLAEAIEKHDESIRSIEISQAEQKEAFEEALSAHASMGKNVMEVTGQQCRDLQSELMELRNATQKDLSTMQGSLESVVRDSILNLTKIIQPPVPSQIPVVKSEMSGQEVLNIMLQRIEHLEQKSHSLELANEILKKSFQTDSRDHERYDSICNQIVQVERNHERQERKMADFERKLVSLASSQSRSLKLLNAVSQKLNAMSTIAWEKSNNDGSSVKPISFNEIVENTAPQNFVSDHSKVAVEVFKEAQAESDNDTPDVDAFPPLKPKDGPRKAQKKTLLKEAMAAKQMEKARERHQTRQSSIKEEGDDDDQEGDEEGEDQIFESENTPHRVVLSPTSNTVTIDEQNVVTMPEVEMDDKSMTTLDSSVMLEEYVYEKLDSLEKKVNDLLQSKITAIESTEHNNASRLNDVAENLSEMEMTINELRANAGIGAGNLASAGLGGDTNPVVVRENSFKLMVREMKTAWEVAFAELDKKVSKMDAVVDQLETEPDEIHRRLSAFKLKVYHALEVVAEAQPHGRDEVMARICDTMEDVRQDALQVAKIEDDIRNAVEKKDPGVALTVSQIPSHLPELLDQACARTTEVLGEKIEKFELSSRIDELAALVKEKVDIPALLTLEEDLRIALSLKADQKLMETSLEKKASCAEVQKFREHINDEVDSMRALLASSTHASSAQRGGNSTELEPIFAATNQRLDLFHKKLQDINNKTDGFVPRQEIETALQALLNEVKSVKGICIDSNALEERLKSKADNDEVERLLTLLQGTVGDPWYSRKAAIQKCLVCDKPVNPFNQSPSRPSSPTSYFDKTSANPESPSKQRPATTSGFSRSQSNMHSYPEKLRQTTELNILRNSLESLPALDDARGSASRDGQRRNNNHSAHSRRIRSAAGGGLGPSYAMDTR